MSIDGDFLGCSMRRILLFFLVASFVTLTVLFGLSSGTASGPVAGLVSGVGDLAGGILTRGRKFDCWLAGGEFDFDYVIESEVCKVQTSDAGKECSLDSECEEHCAIRKDCGQYEPRSGWCEDWKSVKFHCGVFSNRSFLGYRSSCHYSYIDRERFL